MSVFLINPPCTRCKIVVSKFVSKEKRSYKGDDLCNASRGDMFLPTKKRYGRWFANVIRSVGYKQALKIGFYGVETRPHRLYACSSDGRAQVSDGGRDRVVALAQLSSTGQCVHSRARRACGSEPASTYDLISRTLQSASLDCLFLQGDSRPRVRTRLVAIRASSLMVFTFQENRLPGTSVSGDTIGGTRLETRRRRRRRQEGPYILETV